VLFKLKELKQGIFVRTHTIQNMKHLLFIAIIICFPLTLLAQVSAINDGFEGNGNITTWTEDSSTIDTAFSNPYIEEINTSNTVLKYEDTGGDYANVRFQTSENFDLSKNSSFSLKIYVPSNSITGTQQNQISLKLQNSTLAQPWTTQSEIIKTIVLDTWQEVTFNFAIDAYRNQDSNSADPTTRTDFNIVLLQLNSEGNTDAVTGYIDDIFYNAAQDNQNTVVFTDSNLPIVIIETENSATIPDEPKILGTMKIIQRPNGDRNYVTDANNTEFLDYSGTIGIETRGSSSQTLPKKPYGFDTLEEDGLDDKNVKLLGMPKENDWILNSFAFDDSMMRDYISYEMTRKMGQYAVNLRYCEVVLNGEYIGLYALSEKIKRDGDRVDIAKLKDDENSFPEITGGYLMQTDRPSDEDPNAWYTNNAGYIHEKPNSEDITSAQSSYIETVFRGLDQNAANADLTNGYPAIIDVPSFVDYMLIAEISSNVDAYALSTYYHKDRGGKLRAGPVWDYNLTYGNDLFQWGYDRSFTNVWQFEYSNVGANFWGDLFNNPTFKCYASKRFHEVTTTGGPLNYDVIAALIDTTVALISEAVVRENERWNTIEDFSGEIANMKGWIQERTQWMTDNLGQFSDCNAAPLPSLVITKINYNPQETDAFPESDAAEFIEIQNTGNTTVNLTGVHLSKLGIAYQFPKNEMIMAGQSLILASNSAVFKARYGMDAFDNFSRDLSNSSQDLTLSDAFGNVIDQVTYTDEAPWPETADGNGSYLELIDVNSNNAVANNWVANSNESLSIQDFKNGEVDFTVYPNPAKEKITVNAKQTIQEIVIFNPLGQQIKRFNVNLKTTEISIRTLQKGVYYLSLKLINGDRISTKIIKE
jgi:hypothetical protein